MSMLVELPPYFVDPRALDQVLVEGHVPADLTGQTVVLTGRLLLLDSENAAFVLLQELKRRGADRVSVQDISDGFRHNLQIAAKSLNWSDHVGLSDEVTLEFYRTAPAEPTLPIQFEAPAQ